MADATELALGAVGDLDAFVLVLEEAGAALWARGIEQWPAGLAHAQLPQLRAQVEAGALLLARAGARIVGGCIVTPLGPSFWPDAPPATAYLGKLAVTPAHGGNGLGVRIARAAEDVARGHGATRLRLDCWERNPRLHLYYRELGYAERGTARLGSYEARLFEKPL